MAVVRLEVGVQLPDLEEATADTENELGGALPTELAIIDADEEVHHGGLERRVDAVGGDVDVLLLERGAVLDVVDVSVVDDHGACFEGEDAFGHGLAGGEQEGGDSE